MRLVLKQDVCKKIEKAEVSKVKPGFGGESQRERRGLGGCQQTGSTGDEGQVAKSQEPRRNNLARVVIIY